MYQPLRKNPTSGLMYLWLALGLVATSAHADFTPIALNPATYNRDVVVESGAPACLNTAVNATMDGGTNKSGNTWYERGYNTAAPTTGLPPAGTQIVTNINSKNYTFQMPPDYHVNNVIMVGHGNGGRTAVTPMGTLTLTTAAPFQFLSVLTSSGNGPVTVGYVIHYAGGTTQSNAFASVNWFTADINQVFNAAGRVSMGGGVANVGGSPAAGGLYAADITLSDTANNVTSIDFFYVNSNGNTNNNGRALVFALSGSSDGVSFSPVAVSGYNYDVVVEADAPPTTGYSVAASGILTNFVTASMDGGIWLNGSVWHEKGYYAGFPNSGVPAAGSTLVSASVPATYTMPPTYAGNCAAFVSSNITSANIVFGTPTSAAALSFLCASANGDTFVPCTVSFQDGTTEQNTIFVPDWSNRDLQPAYIGFGRVTPLNRTVNSTPDQFTDPFAAIATYGGLGSYDFRGLGLPTARLFDAVINITNTSPVASIALSFTNINSTRGVSIFAVSGASAGNVPPIFGYRGTPTPGQPANAQLNGVRLVKAWEGTNAVVLSVTNIAGSTPISYQWKKATRGSGLRDIFYSIDYSRFANVSDVAGKISGSTASALVISNAVPADSADYLVVASTAGGSVTSLVATLMVLTTNQSLLVGTASGDILANYTGDGSPSAESIDHVADRVIQKWLSWSMNNNTLPFVGPVGYTVTPVSGASICTSMRFFTANDSSGRDPLDYTLEGSTDGATWARITGGVLTGTLSLPTARNTTGSAALDPFGQNCVQVDFANATGYKSYRVTITNTYNRLGDSLMQIGEIELLGTLVPNPPVWVRQPEATATVYVGASPSLTVQATGYPPPRYQWYTNGFAGVIPGATNATFILPNAQLTDSGTRFGCRAVNTFGTITSTETLLTVIPAPTQPYAVAVLGDNPIGYWRLNEGPDNGSGNNGVITRDYFGARNGYYSNSVVAVQGYNPIADPDTAASFSYGGLANNSYVADIKDLTFERGTNAPPAAFSVEAWVFGGNQVVNAAIVAKGYAGGLTAGTGTGTDQFALDLADNNSFPRFRFLVRDAAGNASVAQSAAVPYVTDPLGQVFPNWHHLVGVCDQPNGKVLLYVDGLLAASGNMGPSVGILAQPLPMTIGSRNFGGVTEYTNEWNGTIDEVAIYGTALNANQVLNHFYAGQQPPVITLQPTNQTVANNTVVTFASAAYGASTLGFQWYLSDGYAPTAAVPGQTSPNLVFTTIPSQDQNIYQLVVTNQYGATTGMVARLTVVSGPPSFIVDLPPSDTFLVGHVIVLRVVAGGTAPFTYQWQKDGLPLADNYRTYGSQSNVLVVGYAAPADSGSYSVTVSGAGTPATSLADAVVVTNLLNPLINAAAVGWTTNGTTAPIMSANRLELSSGLGSTARSAFLTAKQNVGTFNLSFIYQTASGAGGADGATFCIQNAATGPSALGGSGGGLGYSGITPSVALGLNIYDPNTRGIRLLQGGTVTTPFQSISPVLIGGNANPVQVNLTYGGGVLAASFRDLVTSSTFTTNMLIDIPSIVGSGSAYVGFTGADGGVASTQVISNFVVLATPIQLKAAHVGGNLVLSWPASTGAYLQSSPSLATPVWTQATDLFRVVGDQAQVTVTPLTGDRFFRLQLFP